MSHALRCLTYCPDIKELVGYQPDTKLGVDSTGDFGVVMYFRTPDDAVLALLTYPNCFATP